MGKVEDEEIEKLTWNLDGLEKGEFRKRNTRIMLVQVSRVFLKYCQAAMKRYLDLP